MSRFVAVGIVAFVLLAGTPARSFSPTAKTTSARLNRVQPLAVVVSSSSTYLSSTKSNDESNVQDAEIIDFTPSEKKEMESTIEDDEWSELTIALAESVRQLVIDECSALGVDLDKELDKAKDEMMEIATQVKVIVDDIRKTTEPKISAFVASVDTLVQTSVKDLTGKDISDPGALGTAIEQKIVDDVKTFTGKTTYTPGDLTDEVTRRANIRVSQLNEAFSNYDAAMQTIEDKRKEWIQGYLGEEAAENYKLGDITTKAFTEATGKSPKAFFKGLARRVKKLVGK